MSDSVGQYLNEIGLVPLLTAEEERELSQIIEKGRDGPGAPRRGRARPRAAQRPSATAAAAKDRFIRANLRLVVSVARRYPLPPGMELLDLIQEGNLGLEHAVDKFDWRKGFKFSTYATFWIRQAIGRALDQKASLVRLPGDRSASLRAALRQVSGDGDELDDEHARLHRLTTPTSLDRTDRRRRRQRAGRPAARRQPRPRAGRGRPRARSRWSPTCSTCSTPGPATRSSSASACTTAASAATARSARSSASPPRRPAAWSSERSTPCARRPRPPRRRRLTGPDPDCTLITRQPPRRRLPPNRFAPHGVGPAATTGR